VQGIASANKKEVIEAMARGFGCKQRRTVVGKRHLKGFTFGSDEKTKGKTVRSWKRKTVKVSGETLLVCGTCRNGKPRAKKLLRSLYGFEKKTSKRPAKN